MHGDGAIQSGTDTTDEVRSPAAPNGPQHDRAKASSGPNPFLVAGAAFGVGTLVAKLIDWRGHAHPRR